jgi:Fic family protein
MSKDNIPFQIQNILDSMLNPKENIYVRGNYRNRLDIIRTEINKAIVKYDNEVIAADFKKRKA